jgi:hypothetical protein
MAPFPYRNARSAVLVILCGLVLKSCFNFSLEGLQHIVKTKKLKKIKKGGFKNGSFYIKRNQGSH